MRECDNSKIHISSNLLLSICLIIMLDTLLLYYTIHVKGKTTPLQPWTGPEGPRRLRLPGFKTIGT